MSNRTTRLVLVIALVIFTAMFWGSTFVSAGVPSPYDPEPEPADVGEAEPRVVVRQCEGVDIAGTPTILFMANTLMYFEPDFESNTNIILPPGTTYRLLNVLTVTETDAATGDEVEVTWYEIDGPCPAGSGLTLWFPEGMPFSVIAQN